MSLHSVQSAVKYSHDIDEYQDTNDLLSRTSIVESLAQELRADRPPQIVGVYGWWGAGKTHVLGQTIKYLLETNDDNDRQIVICTFKAWRYEMEDDLAGGLIRSIVDVEKHNHHIKISPAKKQMYQQAARELLNLISQVSSSFGVPGKIAGALIQSTQKITDRSSEQDVLKSKVEQIESKMEEMIDSILSGAKSEDTTKRQYRLVVFIDDLDRCSPTNMVRMFEWLKVHLRVRDCIYVIGLDHIAAARAIVGHYRAYLDSEDDLAYGLRYLEKLIDSEYELGIAPSVESMAVKHVYPGTRCTTLGQIAHETHGGYFSGEKEMGDLLRLHSLHPPRTMLKIISKYKRAMDRLSKEDAKELRGRLTNAYPFWTLFLIAMYHRLEPSYLSDFIRGRGIIYKIMRDKDAVKPEEWVDKSAPIREMCQFAYQFSQNTSGSLELPKIVPLQQLATLILENTVT